MARMGKFIDLSKCIGCRSCQVACKQWNQLPAQIEGFKGSYQTHMDTLISTHTIVKMKEVELNGKLEWHFRKHQCMHCGDPTCVRVCPHKARKQKPEGAVYREGGCKGCSYCAVKCPFNIPKIDPAAKRSYSCWMCYDRMTNNLSPACAKACPTGAITYGVRDDLVSMAQTRLKEVQGRYPEANLYGLNILGGTGVIYLLLKGPAFYELPVDPQVPAPNTWYGTTNGTSQCSKCHDEAVAAVTYPAEGQTVSGVITATAYSDAGQAITRVDFYVDGVLKGSDTSSPYTMQLDTTKYTDGSHRIRAISYSEGESEDSKETMFNIKNSGTTPDNPPPGDTTPPVASITYPSQGQTVSGQVGVAANASDNVGVTKVEFYVDDALQLTDTTTPYGYNWDTTKVSNGSHVLQVKAYDSAGNVGTSAQIPVTVNNVSSTPGDTNPPVVSITSPANNAKVSRSITVRVSAKDNVGVTKVELYVDTTLVGTITTGSYDFVVDTTKFANGFRTIKAIAYDGTGNSSTAQIMVKVENRISKPQND